MKGVDVIPFFEMFDMLREGPWGNNFSSLGPPPAAPAPVTVPAQAHGVEPNPTPTPAPALPVAPAAPAAQPAGLSRRVVMRGQDPNAALTGKKKLRYELDPNSRNMVRTGSDIHGSDRQEINDEDAYLNAVDRRARKAERGNEAPYVNLHSALTGANDPKMKNRPDFLASKILKQIEGNPRLFQNDKPYSAAELYQILRPSLSGYQPAEIIPSLDRLASFGKNSPFRKVDSAGLDGTRQHGYVFNRSEGQMDTGKPDDVVRPRLRNPAREGGFGRVGTRPDPTPEATPEPKRSAVESMYDSFGKIADQLGQADSGQFAISDTKKLDMLNQLKEMQDQTRKALGRMSQVDDVNPAKVKQFEQLIALMDQEIKKFNPARWVRREAVEQPRWRYF